ncbi:MAG: protein kinase [Myxococcales bacterium]|nr:protein kinase [Myxococcales bacterium]
MLERYDIQELLGEGGFARTYRAVERATDSQVCIKELLPAHFRRARIVERFRQEGQLLREFDHPHIVRCLGEFQGPSLSAPDCQTCYLVLEFMNGGNLQQAVEKALPGVDTALDWAIQGLSGMEALHQKGIIHRDYKPDNLLLDGSIVKVCDLGISRREARSMGTVAGSMMGTVLFASPEQLRGSPEANRPTTDIYGAGATLYWTLTGNYPINLPDIVASQTELIRLLDEIEPVPASHYRKLPAELGSILERSLAKKPEERYQSAHEMRADLERIHGTSEAVTPPVLCLECVDGPHRGACFELWKSPLALGRERGDILLPRDPHLSARHGQFRQGMKQWEFHNAQPTVPTCINGISIEKGRVVELRPGDSLKLGSCVLKVKGA